MRFIFNFFFAYLFKFYNLRSDVIIFNSTVNLYYNFNSKYLFEYFLRHFSHKYECKFVIDDPILLKQLTEDIGDHFISSKKLKDVIYILRAKTWVTSTIDTPIVTLCKNKSRVILHLGHGVPLKNIILAEEKIPILRKLNRIIRTRIFTHVICYSEQFSVVMKKAFRNNIVNYISLGQPRNDNLILDGRERIKKVIFSKFKDLPNHNKAILYAPTWRGYDDVIFFPFTNLSPEKLNELLIKEDTVIFLRKHPYYPSKIDAKFLEQSNIVWFNAEQFPDIMEYLSYFDKLITDYSSIYLDYLCLNKPIAFIPYDLELYKEKVGFSYNYNKLLCGQVIESEESFMSFISTSSDNYENLRRNIAQLVNAKNVGNCSEVARFIENLLEKRI